MIKELYFPWLRELIEENQLPSKKDVIETVSYAAAFRSVRNTPYDFDDGLRRTKARMVYIHHCGFPLMNREVVNDIAAFFSGMTVLEVCAGKGFISKCLKDRGIEIITTDNMSWVDSRNDYEDWRETFVPIEKIDAVEAVKKYADQIDYVLMSWPNYDEPIGADVLQACIDHCIPLVYIGEDMGGCTADDRFFDLITEHCDGGMERITDNYIPFEGIHDSVYLITPLKV